MFIQLILIRHGHLQNHKHAFFFYDKIASQINPTADAFHRTKYTKLRACCFFGIVPNFAFNINPFMTEAVITGFYMINASVMKGLNIYK